MRSLGGHASVSAVLAVYEMSQEIRKLPNFASLREQDDGDEA